MGHKVNIFLIAAVISLVWLPGVAQAAGVGVTPGHLELEAYPLLKATSSLSVTNTAAEAGNYQIYAEGDVAHWLRFSPAEFTLEPGGVQRVAVMVSPPLTARGEYQATVSVVALAANPGLKVGAGVKVPVTITVGSPPTGVVAGLRAAPLRVWIIIALALAVALPIVIRRRRRRRAA